jgi:hypothetical protein
MAKGKNNGWAIASLITGILAILPFFGILMAIAALITGYIGYRRRKQRWMALVGIILGAMVMVIQIIALVTGALNRVLGIFGL